MRVNPRYSTPAPVATKKHSPLKAVGLLVLVVALAVIALWWHADVVEAPAGQTSAGNQAASTGHTATTPSACASNTLSQNIIVSVSQQHLWACSGATASYSSAVVTGMEQYPADLTPVGTYHIYGKQTDQTLAGHDSTGSWSDPVSYWMPFMDNQYGAYGFHDATWRAPSDFGNININAPYTAAEHGSHGCVELPLATAKWVYNWSSVGTTVTIES